jgi:hypothetical protein
MNALFAAAVLSLAAHGAAAPSITFDHSAFDGLLRRLVAKGLVDYDGFQKSSDFAAYLGHLDKVDPNALPAQDRLAYWINVYNAYTIQLIVSHGERASIRNIDKTLFVKMHGPWHEKIVRAGGKLLDLDNVEHDIIRKEFKEIRIHFALVCAAMGCPPLRSEAYTGSRLNAQLDDQAREFLLRSPAKNHIDLDKGIAFLSPIMAKYYRDDFGGSDEAIGRMLANFYPEGPEKKLLASGKAKIKATDYDWSLNSQQRPSK